MRPIWGADSFHVDKVRCPKTLGNSPDDEGGRSVVVGTSCRVGGITNNFPFLQCPIIFRNVRDGGSGGILGIAVCFSHESDFLSCHVVQSQSNEKVTS